MQTIKWESRIWLIDELHRLFLRNHLIKIICDADKISGNRGFDGLMDYTDFFSAKSVNQKNLRCRQNKWESRI
jgi:hypothetical protein